MPGNLQRHSAFGLLLLLACGVLAHAEVCYKSWLPYGMNRRVCSNGEAETVLRQIRSHLIQEGPAQPCNQVAYLKGKPWALQMLAYTASVIVKFMTCSSNNKGWTHWPILDRPSSSHCLYWSCRQLCQAVTLCRHSGTPEAHAARAETANRVGPDG